jgi:predicted nucleotidyltransferase
MKASALRGLLFFSPARSDATLIVGASQNPYLTHMSLLASILDRLRAHESELRERGVVHVAVFGSVARHDDRADSDVDLLVDLTPALAQDFFAYAGVADDLESIVGRDVDVARKDRLRPHVRPAAEAQAVYAF